jgi:crotonobetainyl-CoA:carnitine CoA-transferase CaiB-like acyl-CoA transferase
MVAGRVGTAKAWRALVAWLIEEGAAGAVQLEAAPWSELSFRQTPQAIEQFAAIFGSFAQTRTRLDLYREAQGRGIALSPVNDMASLMADPQLLAREFWLRVPDPEFGADAIFPGPPYRLSATPARLVRPAPELGADTTTVTDATAAEHDPDAAPDQATEGVLQ